MGGYLPKLVRRVRTGSSRLRKGLAFTVAAVAKRPLVIFVWCFLGFAIIDAFSLRNVVVIDSIVVPKALQDRGYTSQAVGDRIRNEIDNLERDTKTPTRKENFAAASDSELPDIQVPMTGISFDAVVRFLQDALPSVLQPPRITGEITCVSGSPAQQSGEDSCTGGLIATVRITHSGRTAEAPTSEIATSPSRDPEVLMPKLAQSVVRLIDPYLLALYLDESRQKNQAAEMHAREKQPTEMQLISECDGKSAKWGWLQWGWILMQNKEPNYDGAKDKFEQAMRIDRNFSLAYVGLARVLIMQPRPDFDGAIKMCHRALGLHYGIGIDDLGYWMNEKIARALMGSDSAHAFAYYNWGNALCLRSNPDLDGAIDKYNKALVIEPKLATYGKQYGFFNSLRKLGDRWKNKQNWTQALAAYCAYHEFQPNDPDGDLAIDSTIDKIPALDLSAVSADFDRSHRTDGKDPNVQYVLGRLRAKQASAKILAVNAERRTNASESGAGLAAIQPAN
jgi:tetratricopeptide (TPR) repeat protein